MAAISNIGDDVKTENDLVKLWNANPDLYQSGDQRLGAYDPSQNLIALFNGANQSTVIHETAHVWLTMLERVAQNGNGKAELDLYTIQKWGAFTEDSVFSRSWYWQGRKQLSDISKMAYWHAGMV